MRIETCPRHTKTRRDGAERYPQQMRRETRACRVAFHFWCRLPPTDHANRGSNASASGVEIAAFPKSALNSKSKSAHLARLEARRTTVSLCMASGLRGTAREARKAAMLGRRKTASWRVSRVIRPELCGFATTSCPPRLPPSPRTPDGEDHRPNSFQERQRPGAGSHRRT